MKKLKKPAKAKKKPAQKAANKKLVPVKKKSAKKSAPTVKKKTTKKSPPLKAKKKAAPIKKAVKKVVPKKKPMKKTKGNKPIAKKTKREPLPQLALNFDAPETVKIKTDLPEDGPFMDGLDENIMNEAIEDTEDNMERDADEEIQKESDHLLNGHDINSVDGQ